MFSYSGGKVRNTRITSNYSGMIRHNLQFAISGNNRVFIHYYTCINAVDIMVGIIQDKSAGIIWNVSRVLQHALCAETFQIFSRFLKMQIGAIHGRFRQNVSSLLQTALAPNAPGVLFPNASCMQYHRMDLSLPSCTPLGCNNPCDLPSPALLGKQ